MRPLRLLAASLSRCQLPRPFPTLPPSPAQRILVNRCHLCTISSVEKDAHQKQTSSSDNQIDDEVDESPVADENIEEMLRKVVATHWSRNKIFVLPWADQDAIAEICRPLEKLLEIGLRPEFLEDACIKSEPLFRALIRRGEDTLTILTSLVECCGWTYEDAFRFFADWSEQLLSVSPESIQRRMDVFLGRGILAGPKLGRIVQKYPLILFSSDPQQMDQTLEDITSFFSTSNIKKLMIHNPQICLKTIEELEMKYEYIHLHMGVEATQLITSNKWMDHSMETIMARHKFIKNTGRFITPDEKKPQLSKENPITKDLFDTSDREFAELAGVSLEEWNVFQQLCELERLMADSERPYPRIKTSMRKRFERRKKEMREKAAGELEDF